MNLDVLGSGLAVLGAILIYWRNKRKFDRTNSAGIEQFPGYSRKLGARLVDLILLALGLGTLTTGVLVVANEHLETWGWAVLLPAYVLLAWLLLGVPPGRNK